MPCVADARFDQCIRADAMAVRAVLTRLRRDRVMQGLSDSAAESCELVLAEAMNNIVEHAYPGQGGPLRLTLLRDGDRVTCRLLDRGRPIPGLRAPPGNAPVAGDSPAEGGYGWFLIHRLTERLVYRRAGRMNMLLLVVSETDSVA